MGRQAERNIAGLLAILMRGGMEYGAYKRRKSQEAEEEEMRAEEQRRYEAEQERKDRAEEARTAQYQGQQQRGMAEAGYKQRAMPTVTADPGSMAAYGAAAQGATAYPDIPGKWWEPLTTEADKFQTKLDQMAQLNAAVEALGGGQGQVLERGVTPQWGYPPRQVTDTGGPSQPDIDRFMRRAEDIADRYMEQQAHAGGQGFLDPMNNNAPNRGHPDWQRVYEQALQSYMGGGGDIDEGPEPDLMENLVALALGNIQGNPEDIAGLEGLRQVAPETAIIVDAMIVKLQELRAGTAGGQVGGLLGLLGQGLDVAERAAALPGEVAALPGRVAAIPTVLGERAEENWPLQTLLNLFR